MLAYSDIIIKPIVTEKSNLLRVSNNVYVFKVSKRANKISVKKVLEDFFLVKVKEVRIINTKPKIKTRLSRSRSTGVKPGYKKAYVVLNKDFKIAELEA